MAMACMDNLPIRGNTGVALADLPLGLLKEFNAKLNYKLIIINFGVNIVSPEHSTYVWYEQRMGKVISYLKEAFPQASILVISIGDKAIKKGTRYITDPGIPALLKTQQTIAEKNGTAFWNLFETMGGENSIVNWEEANPQLSEKDYCHLTPAGGKLVADLLFEALLKEKR
jgi:lysophospholipase L1-like esterase